LKNSHSQYQISHEMANQLAKYLSFSADECKYY
jgi:hypothetical protein